MADKRDLVEKPGLIAASAIIRTSLIEITTYPSVQETSADTDVPVGVALSDAATGESVDYAPLAGQITVLRAGAAISALANITPTTDGEIKTAASGDEVIGLALVAADEADDEIPCLVGYRGLLA